MATARELTVADAGVSALYLRPRGAAAVYLVAHGAGAGMRHPFLVELCARLAARRIATLRFQFPYMEARQAGTRRPPDRQSVLVETVASAARIARQYARGLPLIAGGKSMGGRMTSEAAAAGQIAVDGIAFLGFPLHPAKQPEKADERTAHLTSVAAPMLFLHGTRDALGPIRPMRALVRRLGEGASLHEVRGADHGFEVLRASGRTSSEVLTELAETVAAWVSLLR